MVGRKISFKRSKELWRYCDQGVWGRKEYCDEAYRRLGESLVYEKVEGYPIKKVLEVRDKKLKVMEVIITDGKYRYLARKDNKLRRLYWLPKIHNRLVNVPGRSVVSNCGTATERISEFVDSCLQPVVRVLPNEIKDTGDFLCRLKELDDIPDNAILCSMDVVGLYPHVPYEEGLKSLKKILEEYGVKINFERKVVSSDHLIYLVKIILENNIFEFDSNMYRQKLGTAVETKFALPFVNIFMSDLKREMFKNYHLDPLVW